MFKNYFKIAIRNLLKGRMFSVINITGLTLGLASAMLIGLWVQDELSYDDFHVKKDNLYRVYLNNKGDNGIVTGMAACLPLWDTFKNNDPDIVHVAPTSWGWDVLLSTGDKKFNELGYYVGEDFLDMFTFPLTEGSPKDQLNDPHTIVITESTARELFGDEDPLGKPIRLNNILDLTVSGVVRDPPGNSSFKFKCLIPFSAYMNEQGWVKRALNEWNNSSFNMYVEFREGADPKSIEAREKDVIQAHSKDSGAEVTFLPMKRWRLYSEFENGKSVSGNIVYVRIFSIVGIFILIIACINFINLSTARSERRAREVGLRKSIGAKRGDLIIQFLAETLVMATIAFLISVVLAQLVLPYYNSLVNKHLHIDLGNPAIWISAVAIILLTGTIAGTYPAFYLSAFRPMAVLKGKVHEGRRGSIPRRALVIGQFFTSIILITGTIVVYEQLQFLKNRPVGYDKDNLLLVSATGDVTKNYMAIKHELIDQGLANSVNIASSPVTNIYSYQNSISWPGKNDSQRNNIATIATGYDYTKTTGTKIIQGRDFSEEYADSASCLLNLAAVEYMGLSDPVGTMIHWGDEPFTIVGVIGNAVMISPYQQVVPTMVIFDENWTSDVMVRLPENAEPHKLLAGIENVFKKYNPGFPFDYRFADDEYSRKFSSIRLIGRLANIFSLLAIAISCLGLFGLAAFTAERRTKEIGIRKVLGATLSDLVALLSKEFTLLVIIAFSVAAPLALWQAERFLQQYPYHVSVPWWVLPVTGFTALVLAVISVGGQAIRAASANPVDSLRNE